MGEYWVSYKKMDTNKPRIIKVKAMEKTKDGLNYDKEYTRNQVVDSIEKENHWITCKFSRKEGNTNYWNPGEEIHVVLVEDDKFIRTDRNETKEDNLGDLPDF